MITIQNAYSIQRHLTNISVEFRLNMSIDGLENNAPELRSHYISKSLFHFACIELLQQIDVYQITIIFKFVILFVLLSLLLLFYYNNYYYYYYYYIVINIIARPVMIGRERVIDTASVGRLQNHNTNANKK